MKNKKILIGGLSLMIVAIIGVGATLAYLSSKTDEVRNTFTFSQGISMRLDEDKIDSKTHEIIEEDGVVAGRDEGNQYNNVLPGEVLAKDPTVTILANSPDCYVFVSVKNPSKEYLTITMNLDNWKLVDTDNDGVSYYVYVNDGNPQVVRNADADQALIPVFNTVTVSPTIQEGIVLNFDDIVVKASAIQSFVGKENNYDAVKDEGLALLGYTGHEEKK